MFNALVVSKNSAGLVSQKPKARNTLKKMLIAKVLTESSSQIFSLNR